MDTDGTALPAGVPRASTTAPVPVQKPGTASGATTAGGLSVPPAGTRPAPAGQASPDRRTGPGASAPTTVAPPTVAPAPVTATPVAAAAVAPPPAAAVRPTGPRRARLLVTRLDPWSVMKTAFMLSISIGIVVLVATALLWWTLDVTGVFAAIGRTVDDVAGTSTSSFDFLSLVGFGRVMGVALVLTAIEIVLGSALATLFAFLYNLSVGLTGGVEVTLSEDS